MKTRFQKINAMARQVVPERDSDQGQDILNWNSQGQNNDFPQYLLRLIDNSPTVRGLIETYQQYLFGNGISVEEVAEMKVNATDTANDLLMSMTKDASHLWGYALKVNFKASAKNGIAVHNINTIPFEALRIGINSQRYVTHFVYNPFFGTNDHKKNANVRYEKFTTDKNQIMADIQKEGYKAHVLYRTFNQPGHRFYPYIPLASAKEWIGADGEIQKFHWNNIASGFMLKAMLTVVGNPQAAVDEREVVKNGVTTKETVKTAAQQLEDLLKNTVMGSEGSGVLVQWIQDATSTPKIEPFTIDSYDNLYIELQNLITEQIARVMQIPTQLANINSNQALNVSGDLLQNAVYDMHSRMRKFHKIMERDLTDIFSLYDEDIPEFNITNYQPFPDNKYLEMFWELASRDEKVRWLNENTNFEISEKVTL